MGVFIHILIIYTHFRVFIYVYIYIFFLTTHEKIDFNGARIRLYGISIRLSALHHCSVRRYTQLHILELPIFRYSERVRSRYIYIEELYNG